MTKVVEAQEVLEIDKYMDFKNKLMEYVRLGQIEKALKLYSQYFNSENLFSLSDVSLVDSIKKHVTILINSFIELSLVNEIPAFIAYAKGQTLIRILSQKTTEDECIRIGKIAIMGFGQQASLSADKYNSEIIKKSLIYIHEHLDEKITLQEVSDYVHMAKTYFSAIFKECIHMAFPDYINISKINRSKYYLAHTDKQVSEIAEILGFGSQGYFNTIFKKYSGCSPKEYQMQWRKTDEFDIDNSN